MESPAHRLRAAIEAWRRAEARERVWRWRRSPEADTPAAVIGRHAWVAGPDALEALRDALDMRLLDGAEEGALREHLAQAAAERELAEVRGRLRGEAERPLVVGSARTTPAQALVDLAGSDDPRRRAGLAQALLELARARVPELLDARHRADHAAVALLAGGPPSPDGGPDAVELDALASQLLDRTDSIANERVAEALSRAGVGAPVSWGDLLRAVRAPEIDPHFPRRDRWKRLAGPLAALGFDRDLGGRVRAEPHHGGLDPRARIAVLEAPLDVRLAASPVELGLISELAAAEGLGRALALVGTSPALPVERRRPTAGSLGRAFGALLAQLTADPGWLARAAGVGAADRERVRHAAATALLLDARTVAAAWLARRGASSDADRVALGAELLRRAWTVEAPEPLVPMLVSTTSALGPRLRGRVAGHAAAAGLRDRFDEDWFRNPRAEEALRSGAMGGGGTSAEAWCHGELRVAPSAGIERLIELGS